MTWAQRLKRVFSIDIETCDKCGADVRIIASIEDPAVIQKILAHLDKTASPAVASRLPDCRANLVMVWLISCRVQGLAEFIVKSGQFMILNAQK